MKDTTMINDKTRAMPRAAGRPSVAARLFVLVLEIPPAAYVALTGHAPLWVRVWLSVWLSLWLLVTVVTAINAQNQGLS